MTAAVACIVLSYARIWAQSPVDWNYSSKKIADKTYEIHLTARVSSPWHIYSQFTPAGGPIATKISFNKNPFVVRNNAIKEVGELQQHHEPLFGVDVKYFGGNVDFVQVVTLKSGVKTNMSGNIEFMACNDQECLPPKTISFTVQLK